MSCSEVLFKSLKKGYYNKRIKTINGYIKLIEFLNKSSSVLRFSVVIKNQCESQIEIQG